MGDRDIYDGKYWFKKADILMKEKKRHLEENNKARSQLKDIQNENKQLKDKIKHLTSVIEKFKLKDDGPGLNQSCQARSFKR